MISKTEFEQLITFWSLRGKITDGVDMGIKRDGDLIHQVKRIIITSKDIRAIVTYTVFQTGEDSDPTFRIDYSDISDRQTYRAQFYAGETGLPILEKM